jgi:glycerol kinase
MQLFHIFVQIFAAHTRQVVASHQIQISNAYPQEGWVEQDPKEILTAVQQCIEKAVEKLQADGVEPSDIVAVGITNQRETTVVWDARTGEPLHNAIGSKIYYC